MTKNQRRQKWLKVRRGFMIAPDIDLKLRSESRKTGRTQTFILEQALTQLLTPGGSK